MVLFMVLFCSPLNTNDYQNPQILTLRIITHHSKRLIIITKKNWPTKRKILSLARLPFRHAGDRRGVYQIINRVIFWDIQWAGGGGSEAVNMD